MPARPEPRVEALHGAVEVVIVGMLLGTEIRETSALFVSSANGTVVRSLKELAWI